VRETDWNEFQKSCGRPRRVAWAVAEYDGARSICPLGWKMNTSSHPPMMAISVAPARFTHHLIANSGEFVVAWPGEELARATMLCGTRSGRDIDKFTEAGLTPVAGKHVRVPLVDECIANLECRLVGQMTTGDHTIFAGEVLAVWLAEQPGNVLCIIDESSGYDFVYEQSGYRLGVVRK